MWRVMAASRSSLEAARARARVTGGVLSGRADSGSRGRGNFGWAAGSGGSERAWEPRGGSGRQRGGMCM